MSGDREPRPAEATIPLTRVMLHDLVNHLTIAVGNADLLLLEARDANRAEVTEMRDACVRAIDLVNHWRTRFAGGADAGPPVPTPRARVEPGDEPM